VTTNTNQQCETDFAEYTLFTFIVHDKSLRLRNYKICWQVERTLQERESLFTYDVNNDYETDPAVLIMKQRHL
jgi:hypothetical protein